MAWTPRSDDGKEAHEGDNAREALAVSRRRFAQLLGMGLAGATAAAAAGAATAAAGLGQAAAGNAATGGGGAPAAAATGVVRLSANENPYGPSPAAFEAMRKAFGWAWRYPDEHADGLVAEIARQHGVATEQVLLGAGSSEILRLSPAK